MAKKKEQTLEEFLEEAMVPEHEQPYVLPAGWAWVRFNSIFDNQTDSKKKVQLKDYLVTGMYPVVDQGIQFIGGYSNSNHFVHSAKLPVIIFGDHTRNVKYVDFKFIQGADGVKVLVPTYGIQPKYAYYLLLSFEVENLGYRRHFSILQKMAFPIAPQEEQKRIADKLDSMLGKVKEAREKIREARDTFATRRASILHKAFIGKLTAHLRPKHQWNDWIVNEFQDIAEIKSNLVEPAKYGDMPHIAPDSIEKETGRLIGFNTIKEDGVVSSPIK